MIPGGGCAQAELTVSIAASGDIESECNIGSSCDCNEVAFGNYDYANLVIDGVQVPTPLTCGTISCGCGSSGFCDPNAGGNTLYGDCDGGTLGKSNDFNEFFSETIFNDGNDISIDISARVTALSEEISVSGIVVDCSVLSVELNSFKVQKQEKSVIVLWETEGEINNDYFIIQRSSDGLNYFDIGRVEGAGTTFLNQSYTFVDKAPLLGLNYYRLNQVDFDGKISKSKIQTIDFEDISEVEIIWIHPNPAKGSINIALYPDWSNQANLEILNMDGKVMKQISNILLGAGNHSLEVNIDDLPSGTYIVKSLRDSQVRTGFFVKN